MENGEGRREKEYTDEKDGGEPEVQRHGKQKIFCNLLQNQINAYIRLP